jgi:hypothetical protein
MRKPRLRKRNTARPEIDPESGIRKTTLVRLFEKVGDGYDVEFLYDTDHPNAGGLDVRGWLSANDPTCDPADGIANTARMAAMSGYSEKTLVCSIMPDSCHFHRLGPIRITTVTSLAAGVGAYRDEMTRRKAEGGRQQVQLGRQATLGPENPTLASGGGASPTDVSGGAIVPENVATASVGADSGRPPRADVASFSIFPSSGQVP